MWRLIVVSLLRGLLLLLQYDRQRIRQRHSITRQWKGASVTGEQRDHERDRHVFHRDSHLGSVRERMSVCRIAVAELQ